MVRDYVWSGVAKCRWLRALRYVVDFRDAPLKAILAVAPDVGPVIHASQEVTDCSAGDVSHMLVCGAIWPSGPGAPHLPRALLRAFLRWCRSMSTGGVVHGNLHLPASTSLCRHPPTDWRRCCSNRTAVLLVPAAQSPCFHVVLADEVLALHLVQLAEIPAANATVFPVVRFFCFATRLHQLLELVEGYPGGLLLFGVMSPGRASLYLSPCGLGEITGGLGVDDHHVGDIHRVVFVVRWLPTTVTRVLVRLALNHVLDLQDGLDRRMARQIAWAVDVVGVVGGRFGTRAPEEVVQSGLLRSSPSRSRFADDPEVVPRRGRRHSVAWLLLYARDPALVALRVPISSQDDGASASRRGHVEVQRIIPCSPAADWHSRFGGAQVWSAILSKLSIQGSSCVVL